MSASGLDPSRPLFQFPEESTPLAHFAYVAGLADANGDGFEDVFASSQHELSVLLSNGDGTFQPSRAIRGGDSLSHHGLATVDFNRDGFNDLATIVRPTFQTSEIELISGRGDGTFVISGKVQLPIVGGSIAAGDFNGDGNVDLAVAGFASSLPQSVAANLVICYGYGNGRFLTPAAFRFDLGTTLSPASLDALVAADWNSDGLTDLAFLDGPSIVVIRNLGKGDFGSPQYYGSFGNSSRRYLSVLPDLNGDGRADLASPDPSTGSLTILLSGSPGSFNHQSVPLGTDAKDIIAGDFDKDGNIDLVVNGGDNPTHLHLIAKSAFGTYSVARTYSVASMRRGGLVAADFDRDGNVDLGLTSNAGGIPYRFGVLFNIPGGAPVLNFAQQRLSVSERNSTISAMLVRSGDLDSTVRVSYVTRAATATEADYTHISGTVVFAPGEPTATITVPVIRDNLYEGLESFHLALQEPPGAARLGPLHTCEIVIQDADTRPFVSLFDTEAMDTIGNTTPTSAVFRIALSGPSAFPVSVHISSNGGTAREGHDYSAIDTSITFEPGETEKLIEVPVIADNLFELREQFQLRIVSAESAKIANKSAKGLLTEEPSQPLEAFTPASYAGLISLAPDASPKGLLQIRISRTGAFTGSLRIGGKRASFSGKFNRTGELSKNVVVGKEHIRLALRIQPASDNVIGMIDNGANAWGFTLAPVHTRFPEEKRFTMVLRRSVEDQESVPAGSAPFTIRAARNGSVTIVGRLFDGQAVSGSTSWTQAGEWPLYLFHPRTKSTLAGKAIINDETLRITGTVRLWAAGAAQPDVDLAIHGGVFDRKRAIFGWTEGVAKFSSGEPPVAVTIDAKQQIRGFDGTLGKIRINAATATGFFKGTLKNATTDNTRRIYGVALQGEQRGEGLFSSGTETGSISLSASLE